MFNFGFSYNLIRDSNNEEKLTNFHVTYNFCLDLSSIGLRGAFIY